MCYQSYPNEAVSKEGTVVLSLHGDLSQIDDKGAKLTVSLGVLAMLRHSIVSNAWVIITQVLAFSALYHALSSIPLSVGIYGICLILQAFSVSPGLLQDAVILQESRVPHSIGYVDTAVIVTLVLALTCLCEFLFHFAIWVASKIPKCCNTMNSTGSTMARLAFILLMASAVVIDLTIILAGATLILMWKASQHMGNEITAKIFRLQLLVAMQYIICHADNIVTDVWRFQNFPSNFGVIYRLDRWQKGDFSDWSESQIPFFMFLLSLFLSVLDWSGQGSSKSLMIHEATLVFLGLFGLTVAGDLPFLYRYAIKLAMGNIVLVQMMVTMRIF